MIVLNDETLDLIKQDIDLGKVSSAGFLVAECVKK